MSIILLKHRKREGSEGASNLSSGLPIARIVIPTQQKKIKLQLQYRGLRLTIYKICHFYLKKIPCVQIAQEIEFAANLQCW